MNRQTIKDFVKARLIAANTAAAGRVHVNRVRDLSPKNLPALQIRTLRETSRRLTEAPVQYERTLELGVVCIARADDNVDAVLDALAEEVEDALIAVEVYGLMQGANRVEYVSTDLTLELADSEIGGALVAFTVQYDTRHDPDLDDLEGLNIKLRAKETTESDNNPILSDDVTLPTE